MATLTESSASLTVPENSGAAAIGVATPVDVIYPSSALTISVTGIPSDGTVLLADGVTPIGVGQTLTVVQLTALRFRPTSSAFNQSSLFSFTVSDPAGNTAAATATFSIGASTTPIVTTSASLSTPQNSPATAIGISAPTDSDPAATLTAKITGLPSDGTVRLASNGTAVSVGQVLTVAQLTSLTFTPTTPTFSQNAAISSATSTLIYSVSDTAGRTAAGTANLQVVPDPTPVTTPASLTVAANSAAAPIGVIAPSDANYFASALTVKITGLPADGTVLQANGTTAVSINQILTVQQLIGLQFKPTTGASAQTSSLLYTVTDPSGASASGSVTLKIGASNVPLITTPTALTVSTNSGPSPIGIRAPSDANYAASSLSVNVTALPTDGTVLASDDTTAVSVGQSLTVAQLTGLQFKPNQDGTGQTSAFTYSVSDPSGASAVGSAALSTGLNPIVLENQKPGTPESVWELPNDTDSTNIEGFTTSLSVNHGQSLDFKINTNSAHYRIDIYRLGYYGGDGARLVGSIEHQAPSAILQPAPLTDPTTGLVDAGNWHVTDSWAVPTDATSGVYVANLIREDGTTGESQVPFIVRDDGSHSDIVFQTSDQTWEAYNGWGGANVYGGDGPGPNGAAYAVSYNRPFTTRDQIGDSDDLGTFAGPQDFVFSAEYPAIQWLEQNGYDVSYLSGLDVSSNSSLLLNHKSYIEVGHDEYWTNSQVANVKAAAAAGVNLTFLSGNEIYWQTRLEPSIDGSGTANRTLVTYKDTHANALIDPTGTATGAYDDPRFSSGGGTGGVPSNALTGTVFQVDANRADAIQIPYDMTRLRFWRNTTVANTAPGQTASLPQNLLGYEWDASPDNGFRPGGLIDLSSTTLQVNTKLLDYGNTVGPGTATHNLVEYRDPTSGALIFSAGTVFWSWGLSADHDLTHLGTNTDNATPTSPSVQQAMVNLFADMGIQPQTLQASLVIANQSTDHTAPTSTISNVSATSVVEGQSVTVSGTANDAGGVIGGVEVSSDGGTTWHPATGSVGNASVTWSYTFATGAPGTYALESRAVDDSLNVETPGAPVSYTVTPSSALSLFAPTDTPATVSVADAGAVEVGVKFQSATSGEITGFRFYKGPKNTGTHVAHLWTATGTLLASATFTNETASGWQQVNLTNPVNITAGTAYIASYHTDTGFYSATDFYFDNPGHTSGSLTALGNAGNGLYAYGSGAVFPKNVSNVTADNYYVDVVFNDQSQGPQAKDDSGFSTPENTPVSIMASALLANDTDPNGYALSLTGVGNPSNGTVTYNSANQTVSFAPTSGFTGPASFTYTVDDGHGGMASGNASVAVNYPVTAQSLFNTGDIPSTVSVNDPTPVELGVKFQASGSGTITGIRFYKGTQNTGTHIGDLWSASGTLLASATFASETASGWQQVNFANPVAITAGTTYVASYHTNGNYSADGNYFTSAHTNGELTAPASGTNGGDGVYTYGASSTFPTATYNASNYYVDVVFNGATTFQPPVANNDNGFVVGKNGMLSIPASALLANDTDPHGSPLSVTGVGSPTNGTVTYDSNSQTASFVPTTGYVGPASFVYSIADGYGGSASASVALSVSTAPPVANNDSGFTATENATLAIAASALLANDTDSQGYALSVSGVSSPSHGTATYDASTQTVSFVPTAGYTGPAGFVYSVDDGHGGTASGNVSLDVDYPTSAQSLFDTGAAPGTVTVNDASPVELGVKFQASGSGMITGIRFYKGPQNTGTHIGDLWSASGTLLASATFTNETASGWQQVNFSNPVAITAGTTYVVSYHTNGNYSADSNYFATARSNGQLTAPASGTSGGDGVYAYGSGSLFPANSFNASNYWVDLVFDGSSAHQPPVANNDSGFTTAENAMSTIAASALLANDTDVYGLALSIAGVSSPSHGTVTYDSNTKTVGFVPAAGYTGPAGFVYSVSDGQGGTASANVSLTVTPAANPVATNDSGFVANENTAVSILASALLSNDTDPMGFPLSITDVGSPSHGSVTYDPSTQTANFEPTAGYTGAASFVYSASDGHGGTASATASLIVNDPSTTSLMNPASAPAIVSVNDPSPVELGVKFTSSEAGEIDGLRFYKGPQNTGTHVADLWSGSGSLLASATFADETPSGWQEVDFATPVQITAGTTYVASYHSNGDYSADPNYFASAHTSGALTAPASAEIGGNGVYAYGSSSLFPTSSFNATGYGVDVVFRGQHTG